MAKNRQFFVIGHILLDLGLLGYVSGNTPLAYIGLICALPFFVRELVGGILPIKRKQSKLLLLFRFKEDSFMTKDSKILLVTIVVCTIALAVFQYVMTMKAVS